MKIKVKLFWIVFTLFTANVSGQKPNKTFSFVQICDTQIGMGGYEHDKQSFSKAVGKINALKPDFVIICGDLVNIAVDSTYRDFLQISRQIKSPCYCVPGNHDVGNVPNSSSLEYYRKKIGKDYYTFDKNGVSFIGLNTQLWKTAVGKESVKQDVWFRRILKKLDKRKHAIFVFGHIPLYITDPQEKEVYSNLPPEIRKDILNLLEQHHIAAYLSGHSHTLIINNFKGIQLVSGETTSNNFDKRPFGFRLWSVSPDSIRHRFIEIPPIQK